jgi:UDP-N-acetylglucosamine--N-acetylmuramyl-(pentapeptide) pyrophosphoryl-undecaprenol N-acetylglucosamine transferase
LFVVGGSQGARALNEAIVSALPRFERFSDALQIVHCTGTLDYERVRAAYADVHLQNHVCSFFDDMGPAYAAADLAVCRAGATTIAELTAVGLPAILIPFPFAAENHQYWNARILADKGAALLLPQTALSAERLAQLVVNMLSDRVWLDTMRRASKGMGVPDAARRVVDRIQRLVPDPHRHVA